MSDYNLRTLEQNYERVVDIARVGWLRRSPVFFRVMVVVDNPQCRNWYR
jgi:hypothetical protein